eukprot:6235826-Pyramimonas_sp.AAC.1
MPNVLGVCSSRAPRRAPRTLQQLRASCCAACRGAQTKPHHADHPLPSVLRETQREDHVTRVAALGEPSKQRRSRRRSHVQAL